MLKSYEYEVLRLDVGGIKCDTKGCGWRDDTVFATDYLDWVNKACPDCGGNLLTKADYNSTIKMGIKVIRFNLWCNKWLPTWLLKRLSGGTTVTEFDMCGDGKIRREK